MRRQGKDRTARLLRRRALVLGMALAALSGGAARAGVPGTGAVLLGTADNFAVLAGQGVTNTGPTTVNGDLGTWPNPAVTGAGLTVNGTIHAGDAVAQQAQSDLTVAYTDAAGRTPTQIDSPELGGRILTAGVYAHAATQTLELTGTVTLDGENDPDAVFIFQTASTLITGSSSNVSLINGASACNVFWQVGSSAVLGTNSTLRGTILALTSITVTTGVTIEGRALARNDSVTLDNDTITRSTCTTPTTTGTTLVSSPNPSDSGEPLTLTATVVGKGGGTPTGTVIFFADGLPIGSSLLTDGVATLTTTTLGPGEHLLTSVYVGAPGFESSSDEVTQLVNAPPQTPPSDGTTSSSTAPARTTPTSPSTGRTLPATGAADSETIGPVGVAVLALGGLTLGGAAAVRRRDLRSR